MKMRKILAALSAAVVACSAMAFSASALKDNQKAYQFGGAQVTWGWDADGDKEDDAKDGIKGDSWVGTIDVATGEGTLSIPVEKGAVVDIYCLSWDSVTDKAIFTATIDGKDYDCYYSADVAKPSASYTVESDIKTLEVKIKWIELVDGNDGAINDWCGAGVIVTLPADDTSSTTSTTSSTTSSSKTTSTPKTGATSGLALAGLALAGAAIVATKKSK